MKRYAILLLILTSLSFSSLLWTVNTDGPVSTKPVLFNGNIAVASQDGSVYLISASNGNVLWRREIGGSLRQPLILENQIITANDSALFTVSSFGLHKVLADGFEYIYGISADDKVYVTSSKGVFTVTKKGDKTLFYNRSNVTYTAPATNGKQVVFGFGEKLVSLKLNGALNWEREIGTVWKSAPVIDGGGIYIGTLDNYFYAFDADDGFPRWKLTTDGWVTSTAYVKELIYFGTTGGTVYAVDSATGSKIWIAKTGEGVQSQPTSGSFGGREVLFVGSNDGNLYAIDTENGNPLWKQSAKDWVYSPLLNERVVIFGSQDGSVYAVTTQRACTFEKPGSDYVFGEKEVRVRGKAFSEFGKPSVQIRVNSGEWISVEMFEDEWEYLLDPVELPMGLNKIECKVGDNSGLELAPYTNMVFLRSEDVPVEKLKVKTPKSVQIGEQFHISVTDQQGEGVTNFKLIFEGKEYEITPEKGQNATLVANKAGLKELSIEKRGFDKYTTMIDVKESSSIGTVYLVIGILIILGLLFFVYKKFIAKGPTQQ